MDRSRLLRRGSPWTQRTTVRSNSCPFGQPRWPSRRSRGRARRLRFGVRAANDFAKAEGRGLTSAPNVPTDPNSPAFVCCRHSTGKFLDLGRGNIIVFALLLLRSDWLNLCIRSPKRFVFFSRPSYGSLSVAGDANHAFPKASASSEYCESERNLKRCFGLISGTVTDAVAP